MTELATRPGRDAQHVPGPVELVLEWDGRIVTRLVVDDWTPDVARGPFDVGDTTFCAIAYCVPHREPDGRLTARVHVQPEYPAYRMHRSANGWGRTRGIRPTRGLTGRWAPGAA
jgi:hypothetical protein